MAKTSTRTKTSKCKFCGRRCDPRGLTTHKRSCAAAHDGLLRNNQDSTSSPVENESLSIETYSLEELSDEISRTATRLQDLRELFDRKLDELGLQRKTSGKKEETSSFPSEAGEAGEGN